MIQSQLPCSSAIWHAEHQQKCHQDNEHFTESQPGTSALRNDRKWRLGAEGTDGKRLLLWICHVQAAGIVMESPNLETKHCYYILHHKSFSHDLSNNLHVLLVTNCSGIENSYFLSKGVIINQEQLPQHDNHFRLSQWFKPCKFVQHLECVMQKAKK